MMYYIPLPLLTFHRILFSNHSLCSVCISFVIASQFPPAFHITIFFSYSLSFTVDHSCRPCSQSKDFILLNWLNCPEKSTNFNYFIFSNFSAILSESFSVNFLTEMHFMGHYSKPFWYLIFFLLHLQIASSLNYYQQICKVCFLYNYHFNY